MLAYVFWHAPAAGVSPRKHEAALARYHAQVAEVRPEGFHGSLSFRAAALPWLADAGVTYEDWYLLEASFALDILNQAAVGGSLRRPHEEVARNTAAMAAGLYRLRSGDPRPAESKHACWLRKPEGTSYQDFERNMLRFIRRAAVSLWRREMVLGPTPEFCLLSPEAVNPAARFEPLAYERELIWPRTETS
jgi:hypothetical protein